jgi:two-component system chemotaxis response regulator CheY
MNGEEMIAAVRQNPFWADLPIVVVSTEGSEARIERLLSLGVRFIHKPFAPEDIRKVILEVSGVCHESRV